MDTRCGHFSCSSVGIGASVGAGTISTGKSSGGKDLEIDMVHTSKLHFGFICYLYVIFVCTRATVGRRIPSMSIVEHKITLFD